MTIRCPTCQAENSADSRFCFRCGTALPRPAAAPPPELPARVALPPVGPGAEPPAISGAPVAPPVWGPPPITATLPRSVALPPPGPSVPARTKAPVPLAAGLIGLGAVLLLLAV